ncbi:3-oxoacyl-[acyl-carrier protein] reductase [Mesorhizobium sp. J18]|uniref:SDR family oxidoreductase n=1 Tax=Mesorhizobium sp. J18 TaxID=935263 RepID=UPI00119AF566|nr:SDR family oxidoreductase [Mesorhizobium sp. J18]TWG96418.1 3-oxoacyl-[acyl-carrier protein] reductase [Mesorhizobium sp. J18]
MDLGIGGRSAIVCASSKGLGRACAVALAQAGCSLVINGRDEKALAETAAELRANYDVAVTAVAGDVGDPACQEELLAAGPAPDILVTNGGGPQPREFLALSRDQILRDMTLGMLAPIEMIQHVIEPMTQRGFGRIVNITSIAAIHSAPGVATSSGARAGLIAFLAGIARTVASCNVSINNLLPYKFETDRIRDTIAFAAGKSGSTFEQQSEALRGEIPAGRFGRPEEFGNVCAFLCSAHAGYLTGQNIRLDGGFHPAAF